MFSKNLKYYRLRRNLSKKRLAEMAGVSPMAVTYYESGQRKPGMETIRALAGALGVAPSDFLRVRSEKISFQHGEFRKGSHLTKSQQEYVREHVEDHFSRFFAAVDALGGRPLPEAPVCHSVSPTFDAEKDANALRSHLGFPEAGPVGNLVEALENKGILVCPVDIASDAFSGMSGLVDGRPYIALNRNATPERSRSTAAHEMAHLVFAWPEAMGEKDIESHATAVGGAFLFLEEDALRELGPKRRAVTEDMALVCKEYGISMYLLAMRADVCGIISSGAAKDFYIRAGQRGWKKNEPARIAREEPTLFEQLVFRAVCEGEITIQKGAELLERPYDHVASQCRLAGA